MRSPARRLAGVAGASPQPAGSEGRADGHREVGIVRHLLRLQLTTRTAIRAGGRRLRPHRSADDMPEAAGRLVATILPLLLGASWGAAHGQQPDIVGHGVDAQEGRLPGAVRLSPRRHAVYQRGEERTENTFRMSWAPEPGGRYRVAVVTVRDDGGATATALPRTARKARRRLRAVRPVARDDDPVRFAGRRRLHRPDETNGALSAACASRLDQRFE